MKRTLIAAALAALAIVVLTFTTGTSSNQTITTPVSAGVTAEPNTNYSVAVKGSEGYEEPHNTRVADPYFKLKPTLDPQVPVNLRPHSRLVLTDIEDRTFFDFFAWQTFVGLVWPADDAYRGAPKLNVSAADFKQYNSSGATPNRVPVVFETFRNIDTALPNPPADGPAPAQPNAWNADPYERPFSLDLFSKGSSPDGLNEAFSSPLIDQNRQYVRYNIRINEVMYEFIRQNKWYLKENLPKSPTQASLPPLPTQEVKSKKGSRTVIVSEQQPQTNTIVKQPVNGNSIEIKTAWRLMITEADKSKPWRRVDDLSRYFVSYADIQDPITGNTISNQPVGLVGLHIVVKTPQFTQGIWASFEHVDNVKAPKGIRPSFNGTGQFYEHGYSYKPAPFGTGNKMSMPEDSLTPVEVSRIYKIPDTPVGTSPTLPDGLSTVGLNKTFQKLLSGTVWENYELVITQWPTDPTSFYAKPFMAPRGMGSGGNGQPAAVAQAYERAQQEMANAYPRWSGLPIPQIGCLNTTMETYFQNPPILNGVPQPLESSSCMGCHYGASDMDYSWALKTRTWPQPFNQGRINPLDSKLSKNPANTQ
jgi:hypothetical protein